MRGWIVALMLVSSLTRRALAGPLPPEGWKKPPNWRFRCAQRLEIARGALGKRASVIDAQPNMSLLVVDDNTREVRLSVSGEFDYVVHVTFRIGEQTPTDGKWSDRLLDTKRSQRLLMRRAVRGDRSFDAEIALTPEAPLAAVFVKTFKQAIDACVADLKLK
jgi:hypothetical protein